MHPERREVPAMLRPPVRWALVTLAAVAIALQFVPYGARRNPATTGEPLWNAHTTRDLAVSACWDCHSNQTAWPWYSGIAPVRWFIHRDVSEARAALNFSEFDRPQWGPPRVVEVISSGAMPPARYAALHPAARLTAHERDALAVGLAETLGPQDPRDMSDGGFGFGFAE
jgi:hypothetical protein